MTTEQQEFLSKANELKENIKAQLERTEILKKNTNSMIEASNLARNSVAQQEIKAPQIQQIRDISIEAKINSERPIKIEKNDNTKRKINL